MGVAFQVRVHSVSQHLSPVQAHTVIMQLMAIVIVEYPAQVLERYFQEEITVIKGRIQTIQTYAVMLLSQQI
jgi:hypothetical protein